jgi:hypothetical protein
MKLRIKELTLEIPNDRGWQVVVILMAAALIFSVVV